MPWVGLATSFIPGTSTLINLKNFVDEVKQQATRQGNNQTEMLEYFNHIIILFLFFVEMTL